MKEKLSPTHEFYSLLETAFDTFNQRLFDSKLTKCLLTVQREKKTMGVFSANRWVNQNGRITHEIALNPAYFGTHKVIEIFQTLVHEMCHAWQYDFGTASRRTYHNKEWANKMESIGLMPSHTGLPGGRRTGQKMSDYPIENGLFLTVCSDLIEQGSAITWLDRYVSQSKPSQIRTDFLFNTEPQNTPPVLEVLFTQVSDLIKNDEDYEQNNQEPILQVAAKTPSKIKYSCNICRTNVWGKPELALICGVCNTPFEAQENV